MKIVTLKTLQYFRNKQKQNVALDVYPIGSIYISVNETNPSELFGGSWAYFGGGEHLLV